MKKSNNKVDLYIERHSMFQCHKVKKKMMKIKFTK